MVKQRFYNTITKCEIIKSRKFDYKQTIKNKLNGWKYAAKSKSILRTNNFTAVFDKGYYTGSEIKLAQELGIVAIVAIPDIASNASDERYRVRKSNSFYNDLELLFVCISKLKLLEKLNIQR
jgi:hypothetical protein